ncbi:hypothetical protein PR048_018888 [Dryococelus australis]|uniref:Uncharacterized protein n=1 Tax=Dryococelus australis TaxID=614101 RepID=A0ABQ9H1Y1_9NEOP|nr:hypothetical protein PR048_018888 [Dryococelus australis]
MTTLSCEAKVGVATLCLALGFVHNRRMFSTPSDDKLLKGGGIQVGIRSYTLMWHTWELVMCPHKGDYFLSSKCIITTCSMDVDVTATATPAATCLDFQITMGSGDAMARALISYHANPGSIPGGFAPGSLHVGIVLDDAAGWRVFSGYSRFPCPCIPAPLHPKVSFHVMFRDYEHLRVPAGKPVTQKISERRIVINTEVNKYDVALTVLLWRQPTAALLVHQARMSVHPVYGSQLPFLSYVPFCEYPSPCWREASGEVAGCLGHHLQSDLGGPGGYTRVALLECTISFVYSLNCNIARLSFFQPASDFTPESYAFIHPLLCDQPLAYEFVQPALNSGPKESPLDSRPDFSHPALIAQTYASLCFCLALMTPTALATRNTRS